MILTDGVTSITLPDDLQWTDEFDYDTVEQAVERSVTGAQIIHIAVKTGGRPITLESGDRYAWISRATVDALRALAATPDDDLTLTISVGRVLNCRFRRHDGPAIEAKPVMHMAPAESTDRYLLTLRLMEI